MEKSAIRKFAIWARRELIERVTQRAYLYGIDAGHAADPDAREVRGHLLTKVERDERRRLIARIRAHGFEAVIDEVAYTWFNRFAALRYMEVNGVLPTRVRVFSDRTGAFRPEILTECLTMEGLGGLDRDVVFALKEQDKTDDLYKYLLITQCNALAALLPALFEPLADETELLLPDNLLREGSVIEQLVTQIPEDDWRDAVQIIGWLYQYYNSEPKAEVFAALKRNVKVSKEHIPAATQLFTPDWIVRYMVENSLGRVWIEHNIAAGRAAGDPHAYARDFAARMGWRYYLPEAPQGEETAARLIELRAARKDLRPEDIRVLDPCMGSGHILVYAFDVLMQIYKDAGYAERTIPALILTHNLYGLDIDDRAYQLAGFAVLMRAWQYSHRILQQHLTPHLAAIQESNGMQPWAEVDAEQSGGQLTLTSQHIQRADELIELFHDAKEYGSILTVPAGDDDGLAATIETLQKEGAGDLLHAAWLRETAARMLPLIRQAKIMSGTYDVVVTNPPYMSGSMNATLTSYLKKHFKNSKGDLYAVFMERCAAFLKASGMQAMITQHSWMFLTSYETMRAHILAQQTIVNMAHLGPRAFEEIGGEVVQTTAFVFAAAHVSHYRGTYARLLAPTSQQGKEEMFLRGEGRYVADAENFQKIPGAPIAYWIKEHVFNIYTDNNLLQDIEKPRTGMTTGSNDTFIRMWQEVPYNEVNFKAESLDDAVSSQKKWFPYAKGGGYKRWYGFYEYLVNWENGGESIRNYTKDNGKKGASIRSEQLYFKKLVSWSAVTSSGFSCRLVQNALFDSGGSSIYSNSPLFLLALLNGKVSQSFLNIANATINYQPSDIGNIPIIAPTDSIKNRICLLAKENIKLSKSDWDSFETSWDFQRHPLVPATPDASLADCYRAFQAACEQRFLTLKENEEALNRIFIDIYGLADELTPDVAEKDVTVARVYDTRDDIPDAMKGNGYVLTREDVVKSLLSYAVGCMFGRYSLDTPGLAYAGGTFDASAYRTFAPDADDIIPICDDEYFEDDLVSRLCTWLKVVYGEAHYQENLCFLSDALGGKGAPLENLRAYFLDGFYRDHCRTYKKRPIYWLFDAGRRNSFKALVYLHRYDRDTMARMRTGYVYKQQELYKTRIATYEARVTAAATQSDKAKYKKLLKKLQDQFDEIHAYEERIHHYADLRQPLDLDDGVKHNYALFADVLAKIK